VSVDIFEDVRIEDSEEAIVDINFEMGGVSSVRGQLNLETAFLLSPRKTDVEIWIIGLLSHSKFIP